MQPAYPGRVAAGYGYGTDALPADLDGDEAPDELAEDADDLEVLSGDIVSPVDRDFAARDEDALYGESTGAAEDPWWEMLSATGDVPTPRATWSQRLHRLTTVVMPFGLRERAVPIGVWRVRILLLGSLVALVALTAFASVATFGFASHLVRGAPSQLPFTAGTPGSQGGVIIQPNTRSGNATPTVPADLIGAWTSNNAPSGGSVQIFVRVTHGGSPAGGIPVQLTIGNGTYGPVATDGYGVATFTVNYGGGFSGYMPIFVTASASIDGQTITAQTSFAPQ
jgi:hypothetical protein